MEGFCSCDDDILSGNHKIIIKIVWNYKISSVLINRVGARRGEGESLIYILYYLFLTNNEQMNRVGV